MTLTRLYRCFGYVMLHAAICLGLSLLTAFMEIQLAASQKGPNSVTEFAGIPLVVALTFIGPVSIALSLPAHVGFYFKAPNRAHAYSIAASIVAIACVWLFLHL